MNYTELAAQALAQVSVRNYQAAIPQLRRLLHETYVSDFEYDDWLRGLADSQQGIGQPLAAGFVYLYLHYFDKALECFQRANSPLDLALCYESQGKHAEAAQLYQREHQQVRAACSWEHLGRFDLALPLWERLLGSIDRERDPYAAALALLNWVHCAKQAIPDEEALIKRRLVAALVALEGIADEREQQGMLDEALDCYMLMIQIGLEQRAFENLSEGYINAIRILKERGRMLTALRYYAGIGKTGSLWGEHHAVATLYREAAEDVQRAGMLYANYYLEQAAQAWVKVAQHHMEIGAPPELTENALLAALDGFNQLDDSENISRAYYELSQLAIAPDKQARYQRLMQLAQGEKRQKVEIFAPSRILLREPRHAPLWREDLLDWEQGEEILAVLSQVVWDLNYHDTVRRKALNLVLFDLDLRDEDKAHHAGLNTEIARTLAHMKPKVAFRGLKKLARHSSPGLRAEAVKAAGTAGHASGLTIIEQALSDSVAEVKRAAIEALQRHNSPESFDALKRILESHRSTEVQQAVLATMARIRTFEVAEYLYRMLVANSNPAVEVELRRAFQAQLSARNRRIFSNRLAGETQAVQQRLSFLQQQQPASAGLP